MKYVAMALVYAYRYTLGLLFPASCKYHPSCSQYALDALREHGLVRGSALAAWRLLRCNPWSYGGVDPVPRQGSQWGLRLWAQRPALVPRRSPARREQAP